jgi:hypothetical protein
LTKLAHELVKGIDAVTTKGHTYYYAWRAGRDCGGNPAHQNAIASYSEACAQARALDTGRFRFVVTAYKTSADYRKLAESTKRNWAVGWTRSPTTSATSLCAQFDRPEKIRPVKRRWRNQWADKPQSADYAMQVLSRVLSYAVDPLGRIASNPCEGVKQLYRGDRSEIIWTDVDIAYITQTCAIEVAWAVDLAEHTGLRRIPKRSTAILTKQPAPSPDREQLRHRLQPGEDRRRYG